MSSSPCNMSGNEGYGYGNDYSYGYDYTSQSQNLNKNYDYNNYIPNQNNTNYSSPYSQTTAYQPQAQEQPYNPAAAILSNPAAQIGMQFGTQALNAGQDYVNNNVSFIKYIYVTLIIKL